MTIDYISSLIRDVPDFPKPGILFKDITPVLQDARGLRESVDLFVQHWRTLRVDRIIAIESRGFLFGARAAAALGLGLGVVRKMGKLPYQTIRRSYALEYGNATLEAHIDTVQPGMRVVIIDDLLATGGTALAAASLIADLGAKVLEAGFLVELAFLPGRQVLEEAGIPVFAPIVY